MRMYEGAVVLYGARLTPFCYLRYIKATNIPAGVSAAGCTIAVAGSSRLHGKRE